MVRSYVAGLKGSGAFVG